jgi:hypothetical protein
MTNPRAKIVTSSDENGAAKYRIRPQIAELLQFRTLPLDDIHPGGRLCPSDSSESEVDKQEDFS